MDQVLIILAFLVGLVGLYFTYMIVNVVVTIIKSKKRDHSLKFCMSPAGKAFLYWSYSTLFCSIIWLYRFYDFNIQYSQNELHFKRFKCMGYLFNHLFNADCEPCISW